MCPGTVKQIAQSRHEQESETERTDRAEGRKDHRVERGNLANIGKSICCLLTHADAHTSKQTHAPVSKHTSSTGTVRRLWPRFCLSWPRSPTPKPSDPQTKVERATTHANSKIARIHLTVQRLCRYKIRNVQPSHTLLFLAVHPVRREKRCWWSLISAHEVVSDAVDKKIAFSCSSFIVFGSSLRKPVVGHGVISKFPLAT